jgi:uncharacterized membrane protein
MVWNLFLAVIPALLALRLFRPEARRGVGWWFGAAAFMAFLPNAAYVLTDVIHLPEDLRAAAGSTKLTLAVVASYGAFAAIGFTAYAYSVMRLMEFLRAQGLGGAALITSELGVHLLATAGVILGRVFRFNSWDLVARPDEVLGAVRLPKTEYGVAAIAFFVATLAVGTLLVRLAVAAVKRTQRLHSR